VVAERPREQAGERQREVCAKKLAIDVCDPVPDLVRVDLTEQQIADYIASGEPMGKAGAYGIQGRAARFIPRIEGCYFNVVGLPLARVSAMLGTIR